MRRPSFDTGNEADKAYKTQTMCYCKYCLSLKILKGNVVDYCDSCGSADIGRATLEEYDALYKERYGRTFFKK